MDIFPISLKHFPFTSIKHYGIQRLVRVTDTEGNVTTSTYDMGDLRTEVNHPASGITSFTYDALGNVLTKQTANLVQSGADGAIAGSAVTKIIAENLGDHAKMLASLRAFVKEMKAATRLS